MSIEDVLSGAARWHVECGDCLDVLRAMPDASVDAVVTDPPYGLHFMGKAWDRFTIDRQTATKRRRSKSPPVGSGDMHSAAQTAGEYDFRRNPEFCEFMRLVGAELLRVAKPGAHLVMFGGQRTHHWAWAGVELAGWEIRDTLSWIFGSGFPKSLNISKAIDSADGLTDQREIVHSYTAGGNAGTPTREKGGTYVTGAPNSAPVELHVTRGASDRSQAWDGWGSALKPAHEPICLARKPLGQTVAANVLQHGTGGLNIDACRVATDWNEPDRPESWKRSGHTANADAEKIAAPPGNGIECHPGGRWPANVILGHSESCRVVGEGRVLGSNFQGHPEGHKNQVYGKDLRPRAPSGYADADGLETVPVYDCAHDCPVRLLSEQSGELTSGGRSGVVDTIGYGGRGQPFAAQTIEPSSGTAARFFNQFELDEKLDAPFFYCAKAATAEREDGLARLPTRTAGELTSRKNGTDGLKSPRAGAGRTSSGRRNSHPTVKPVALMRWLVRLVTPPGGVVLDPFAGSFTTGVACWLEDFRVIGIEREAEYVDIGRARVAHAQRLGRQQALFEAAQ
jgi:site-specific DNA-methyltransferase (adenine-specific)